MGDQLTALKELAEKVETGTWDMSGFMSEHDLEVLKDTEIFSGYITELIAVVEEGSLDAAHALHKPVLGDRWDWQIDREGNMSSVTMYQHNKSNGDVSDFVLDLEYMKTIPAHAWLLAIIKAKIQELEQ